ncbi:hypothetical protein [Thioalkalivibrio sp. XN279]|uniref:hypothetical protein n=1 Tax=Thioalkalivibrio sp. XN279 TaxID=2714953 RepID=UPI00140ADCC8|nr:hypothetical protein [Thioalkalivibrio sp. XN279]NHA14609.1 hypothetical protein [Thioalkalivibrio sp. XN279]
MNKKERVLGSSAVSVVGIAATIKGLAAAAGPVLSTAKISAIGATVGGGAGAMVGSGVGIATGGIAMPGTIPFAVGGAAIGSWAGPALAVFGIGTAPAWAVPLAIAGGVVAVGGTGWLCYQGLQYIIERPDVSEES